MDKPRQPEDPELAIEGKRHSAAQGRASAAPVWLWLGLMGGFAIIFWQFIPKTETAVEYNPWFLDQVASNNIQSLAIRDIEIRGELRQPQPYSTGARGNALNVVRFVTYFPSSQSIEPVISALRRTADRVSRC